MAHDRRALPRSPDSAAASRAKDFRQADALADALLHPVDRAYTVPQLHGWLNDAASRSRAGMSRLPSASVRGDRQHAARAASASLPPPLQHAAVELLRGTMTKHDFVAYRDDRAGESQPIAFEGQDWLSYVPLRLPWALVVRERLPPGAAAVLINRAHASPTLRCRSTPRRRGSCPRLTASAQPARF